ncbi:hypothetical protein HDU98_006306 [Podochytrium sp. JEL0797]|nr:hypothetical protein HDU98_006306 [Podochytrium sp. JEL0797]
MTPPPSTPDADKTHTPTLHPLQHPNTKLRAAMTGADFFFQEHLNRINVSVFPATTAATNTTDTLNHQQRVRLSFSAILSRFQRSGIHPDRLLYVVAGILFEPNSPLPFGGSKTNPGYARFNGPTTHNLLTYIISSSISTRSLVVMETVARAINSAVEMHAEGALHKEVLDELMMKGMKKSGHAPWMGVWVIPVGLRFQPKRSFEEAVFFAVNRVHQ